MTVAGVDLTGCVDVESLAPSSVVLVAVDAAGDAALEGAIDGIGNPVDAVVTVGEWRGEWVAYRNRSRTADDRLRVAIGVRLGS